VIVSRLTSTNSRIRLAHDIDSPHPLPTAPARLRHRGHDRDDGNAAHMSVNSADANRGNRQSGTCADAVGGGMLTKHPIIADPTVSPDRSHRPLPIPSGRMSFETVSRPWADDLASVTGR
jgi:hypothetical protein